MLYKTAFPGQLASENVKSYHSEARHGRRCSDLSPPRLSAALERSLVDRM